MDDDDLFPDLADFRQPAASTSSSATFDFPLDPSLFGPPSSSRAAVAEESHSYASWDGDDSVDEGSEEDETDAEDEYRAEMGGGVKRKKGAKENKGKGKAVAEVHDTGPGLDDREELARLIDAIRESNKTDVGGRTALDKEFDRSIEEELEGIDDPLFQPKTGKGGRKGRGQGRRAAADAEPSHEVKALIGTANRLYANGEHEEALEMLSEVVRIDPGLRAPWFTLATIHEEQGNREKAVMFKIVATHLSSKKAAMTEWAHLGGESRDIGLLQQAIYCYTQAIRCDKTDVDSMWDRAVLLKLSGSTKQATTAFKALLNIHPHDPGVLRELAPLLASQGLYAEDSTLFSAAFDYFRTTVPHVTSSEEISSFGTQDLETLADVLHVQRQYAQVVNVIRTGVRWLQGREKETGWDVLEDDREYDQVRKTRDGWEREARFLEEAKVYDLDVRLRTRLGAARMGEGKVQEAQRHFAIILEEDVAEFPELFGAVADAYLDKGMHTEALEVYQDIAEDEETNGPHVWIKVAQCHHAMGDLEDARDCYEAVVEAEPENLESKMQLAKIYEEMNDPTRALAMINDIIDARRRLRELEEEAALADGRPREARRVLSKEERAAAAADRLASENKRHQEFSLAFLKLERLERAMEGRDDEAMGEWLEVATYLVDSFRETRQLFPSDSKKKFTGVLSRHWKRKGAAVDLETQAGVMASRLERSMDQREEEPDLDVASFRGLNFDGWLRLIIKYAFFLTKNDETDAGQETLIHVQSASVFKQSEHRSLALQLARAACYKYVDNATEVVGIARMIALRYQFTTNSLRLLQALIPSGLSAIDAFNSSTLQKFSIRQLKAIEHIARGREVKIGRTGMVSIVDDKNKDKEDKEEEEEEEEDAVEGANSDIREERFLPTKPNPLYLLAYGTMLMASRSYQSAIVYFVRAYDLVPHNPLVNLCLGISYLHRAMSRQTDNRHHQIAQGLAFMSQYRKLKGPCQEVEYNFARAFHHLGLQSYAIKHYEATLSLASEDRLAWRSQRMNLDEDEDEDVDEPDDFARVAAYNLSSLYVLSGNSELARKIARQWLAV